jgi:flagellar biosynthesis regulator FlaF
MSMHDAYEQLSHELQETRARMTKLEASLAELKADCEKQHTNAYRVVAASLARIDDLVQEDQQLFMQLVATWSSIGAAVVAKKREAVYRKYEAEQQKLLDAADANFAEK